MLNLGAELYCKSVQTCCRSMEHNKARGELWRTKVYGCELKYQKIKNKVVSQCHVSWAANCFHYNLINTSKRICTNSAISNRAI